MLTACPEEGLGMGHKLIERRREVTKRSNTFLNISRGDTS
jgi:hypothetical protein